MPQCNKVGVPPIARQPFVVAGKIASDNAPAVKLDGTTVASSTDMYSFLPGHELTFTASVNPTVGVHALSFIVHNGGVIDTAAATATGLNPAQIVAWQSMLNSGTDPTGMSARANISQACR